MSDNPEQVRVDQIMQVVADELRNRGYSASIEHPGYIHVPHQSEPWVIMVGTANNEWGFTVMDDECQQTIEDSIAELEFLKFKGVNPSIVWPQVIADSIERLVQK